MNPKHILAISIFAALSITCNANATPFDAYLNSITIRNIATMQHSIATNAIQTFEGTMAAALGNRAHIVIARPGQQKPYNPEYSSMSQYGKMPIYGEYNDDGTAIQGRNGGDIVLPSFNSLWANWQHFDDDVKFKSLAKVNTDYDLVTIALDGGHAQMGQGISQWGLFGGYAGSTQDNKFINIDETGGYIGVYSGYNINNINISASVNAGALSSDADFTHETIDYSNTWVGATAHSAYNIAIDDTFTLQPSLYIGYTWVKSDNYTIGKYNITNTNLNTLEITPEIRAIKHIGAGWFGTAKLRYVINWDNGGKSKINNTQIADLDTDNYAEYSIGLEKSIDRFNIALHIGRRDGGRTGWHGGTSFKYIF
ncbi:MAG: autotransporter outer membrane beta-barrel domain-containing protein [Alphaproteobacteria bacterium]|nr:autotransporter outer membrane beta-barrel domain-containing protein [Alphaproteobacteria bacterium]